MSWEKFKNHPLYTTFSISSWKFIQTNIISVLDKINTISIKYLSEISKTGVQARR